MELTLTVMFAQCPTTPTGTTSPRKATVILLQVQPAIEPEIIQAAHTTTELATPSIRVHAEGSTTTTAMDIRPTFQNETYGNVNEDLIKII